jgi:hypothetical protein
MKDIIESYISDIEMLFFYSPIVFEYFIRERDIREKEGYIRIRARLSNRDIFEAFEFVTVINDNIRVLTYRLQWQTADGQLKKRWDNAEHHGEIATFPYHVHVGASGEVQSSEAMSIQKALEIIEAELLRTN